MSASYCKKSVFKDEDGVVSALCDLVVKCAQDAIKDHGLFFVGVSGGSVAKYLAKGLAKQNTEWNKWRLFFCDERHVPLNDSDSTYKVYKEGLLSQVNLSEQHVFKIKPDVSVQAAATDYIEQMKDVFGKEVDWPTFDLLLLGMGPDGHTCSLFPGHQLLKEDRVWIAAINDSPKPPPSRITMTFPVINRAHCSVFAACGDSKADMVQNVLEGADDPPLPAAMVKSQTVHWFLDEQAASKLKLK